MNSDPRSEVALCIFAKAPTPGRAKTRLAPKVGEAVAARFAEAFLYDTWAAAAKEPWAAIRLCVVDPAHPFWASFRTEPVECELWAQGDGDLGARMESCLHRALAIAPRAIVIGSDSPGLPREFCVDAAHAFQRSECVIGPSDDGGYYLLGVSRRGAVELGFGLGALANLPWSQSHTRSATLTRIRERGLEPTILRSWFDVDYPEDLLRLKEILGPKPEIAPASASMLRAFQELG